MESSIATVTVMAPSRLNLPIYVISLPSSPRRVTIAAELARIGVEADEFRFWDGVLVPEDRDGFIESRFPNQPIANDLTHGTLGCLMSYIDLCAHLASTGVPAALVLEDDVEFMGTRADFEAVDWDDLLRRYAAKEWVFLHWYSHLPNATQAQIVTLAGARRMTREAVSMINRDAPIDIALHCDRAFDSGDLMRDTGVALFNHLYDRNTSDKFIINQIRNGTTDDHRTKKRTLNLS